MYWCRQRKQQYTSRVTALCVIIQNVWCLHVADIELKQTYLYLAFSNFTCLPLKMITAML